MIVTGLFALLPANEGMAKACVVIPNRAKAMVVLNFIMQKYILKAENKLKNVVLTGSGRRR